MCNFEIEVSFETENLISERRNFPVKKSWKMIAYFRVEGLDTRFLD